MKNIVENIRKEFKNYMVNTDRKSVVLGVSGGIDSAIVAALVRPVCDEIGIKLIGISLPAFSNKDDENSRAKNIGKEFCHNFSVKEINDMFSNFINSNLLDTNIGTEMTERERKIGLGNVKARIRMITLYNAAYVNKGLVLSTDNLTEYHLGFWTIHGDVGDLGLIQNLWKTEVYQISQWIVDNELKTDEQKKALQDCINAVPTDGLGITKSDLDQIGAKTYAEVDENIKNYLYNIGRNPEIFPYKPVIEAIANRCKNSNFKRDNPHNIERKKLFEGVYNDF